MDKTQQQADKPLTSSETGLSEIFGEAGSNLQTSEMLAEAESNLQQSETREVLAEGERPLKPGETREVLVEVEGEEAIKAELAKLPKINWGALFMPAIWGPAHGSWITILFYPIWIFADNCLVAGVQFGGLAIAGSIVVFLGTAALMIFYGMTAGQKAYLRVAHKITMEDYLKRERIWAVVSLLIALVFIAFATWYNLTIVLPAGIEV